MLRAPVPPRTDVLVAAAVAAVTAVDIALNPAIAPRAAAVAAGAACAAAVAWRRAAPLAATVVVVVASTAQTLAGVPLDEPLAGLLSCMIVVYALTSYVALRRALLGTALFLGSFVLQSAVQGKGAGNVLFGVVFVGAMWAMGWTVRRRTAQAVALEVAAERARAEQESRDRLVAEAERTRIARELHDVIAHSLSVMVVQAGAASEVLARDPERARQAVRSVETTGREALAEMASLLGVLRGGGEEVGLQPQPGIADVERLVAECHASGHRVVLQVEGQARHLPPGVELAVYRIVQEALTNARKHAGGAPASVRLAFGEAAVDVEVVDGGSVPAPVTPGGVPGGGHGLVGMRERVAVYGGELSAGRAPDGGYAVRARLPVQAAP